MKPSVPNQKTAALTLVEVLVVIFVLFILAALLLPAISDHPRGAPRAQCLNNLKQVAEANLVWAGDHNGRFPMQVSVTDGGAMEPAMTGNVVAVFQVMSNGLSTPRDLVCPADKGRIAATNFATGFSAKNISYFVGLDTLLRRPKMLLSGDDNFAIGGVPVKSGLLEVPANSPVTWTAERHKNSGNIGRADGIVERVDNAGLIYLLLQSGVATNRLAIP